MGILVQKIVNNMNSLEQSPKKESSAAETVREVVAGARRNIEREFASGAGNSWVACFKTVLTALNGWVYLAKSRGEITSEAYERAHSEITELTEAAAELHKRYPKVGDVPPDEVKEELISRLERVSEAMGG